MHVVSFAATPRTLCPVGKMNADAVVVLQQVVDYFRISNTALSLHNNNGDGQRALSSSFGVALRHAPQQDWTYE